MPVKVLNAIVFLIKIQVECNYQVLNAEFPCTHTIHLFKVIGISSILSCPVKSFKATDFIVLKKRLFVKEAFLSNEIEAL